MRITFIQITLALIFTFSSYASPIKAQAVLNKPVTVVAEQKTVKKILAQIQKQTSVKFTYSSDVIDITRKISCSITNKKLIDFLTEVLKPLDIDYQVIDDEQILLFSIQSKTGNTLNNFSVVTPIDVIISGVVTNEKGEPLQGATITEKGTKNISVTDAKGNFKLKVTNENAVIIISYTGYKTEEVVSDKEGKITVALTPINKALDEVVVIGYGSIKKKDLTGSVAQVKTKELNAFPTGNILQALSGRATGVQVLQNDGTPGAPLSIRIRGTNSILGSNEPLYVIDGFPGTTVNNVQATDIETIEILKDASATAIYGSRGANGVVIITTKKGKAGKTEVDYETSYGRQRVTKKLNLMNGLQWAKFYNEQAVNDGLTPYFTGSQVDSIGKLPITDWQDQVLQKAPITLHSLTISGGNEKTQFSISGNAFLQDGIIRNSGYDRYTLRANINHTISKIFSLSVGTLLTKEQTDIKPLGIGVNRGGGLISAMETAPPILSPYNSDGTFKRINTVYPWLSNVLINPLTIIYGLNIKTITNRQLANVAFDIKPVSGMVIKLSGGVQNTDSRYDGFALIDPIINSTGAAYVGTSQITSLLSENTISYSKTFGDHSISTVGGFSYQDYTSKNLNASGSGFLSNSVETYNLQGAAIQGIASTGYSKSVLLSYYGRLNYTYKGRYLATVSYRRDGSSKFSVLNKWSDFPSAAIAWRISEEKFMRPFKAISNLKLRGSYGATGNNALDPYQTLNALGSNRVVFNDALYTSYGPGTTKPGQLKWETTYGYDAGLDLGLFDNKINITVDYYHKKTKDRLNSVQLPASTGYTNTLQNVGEIQNKGWEFAAAAQIADKAVKWNVSANVSFNRNKITKLYGGQDIYGSVFFTGPLNDFVNLLREGQPLGIFYGYLENGYTSTGNIRYKDLNGDGNINSLDKTYIGNPNPKFIYGFNSDVSYKGFGLTVFIQGSQGNDIYNLDATQTIDLGFGLNVPVDVYNNHWTPANTNAKYPKISRSIAGNVSNRFVEDGSYLRFKNIQLAYNLPSGLIKWARNIQLYISGQNLITITKFSWYDPEINSLGGGNSINQGISYFGYPTAKTLTFGIRC
ncbi:TonB-dependent receptor, partial [Hydrotalea sp.]|uniref:SusC/RagA family TonB-linked outer membrane protein n=1 Tax=Hydrotalea sp. TaxID=2881279 RepID=UPI00260F444F